MKKPILTSSILAASALLSLTAFGQVINGDFSNSLTGWTVEGSNAVVLTRPSNPATVAGLGNAKVVNGNTALLTSTGGTLSVTRLSQTFSIAGQNEIRKKFGKDVGHLQLSTFGGSDPRILLGFQFKYLTNEAINSPFDFGNATLNGVQLVYSDSRDKTLAAVASNGFTNSTPVKNISTDISQLLGTSATLSFLVADTLDKVVDSGIAIQNVTIAPYVLEDVDTMNSAFTSGLPMALAQRGILLNAVDVANRDVNERLFRLRLQTTDTGSAGPTGHGGSGKDGKSAKKTVVPVQPPEYRWEVFASGSYGNRDVETALPTPGFSTDLGAGTVGFEYKATKHITLGAAATFLEGDNNLGLGIGDVEIEGFAFSGYVSLFYKNFYADVLYSLGTFHNEIHRDTGLGHTATARPDSLSHSVLFNTGYNFAVGPVVTGPIVALDYVNGHIDGYTEDHGGSAGVSVSQQNVESLISRVGWQVSYPVHTGFGSITPQVRATWVHEYLNNQQTIGASLIDSPYFLVNGASVSRIGKFTATGSTIQPGDDYLGIGGGVSCQIGDRASVVVDYETRIFQNISTGHVVSLTGTWKF